MLHIKLFDVRNEIVTLQIVTLISHLENIIHNDLILVRK